MQRCARVCVWHDGQQAAKHTIKLQNVNNDNEMKLIETSGDHTMDATSRGMSTFI